MIRVILILWQLTDYEALSRNPSKPKKNIFLKNVHYFAGPCIQDYLIIWMLWVLDSLWSKTSICSQALVNPLRRLGLGAHVSVRSRSVAFHLTSLDRSETKNMGQTDVDLRCFNAWPTPVTLIIEPTHVTTTSILNETFDRIDLQFFQWLIWYISIWSKKQLFTKVITGENEGELQDDSTYQCVKTNRLFVTLCLYKYTYRHMTGCSW